jgi:hypothetical protein
VKLIVEVKGCWHQDLKTDMEQKLRDRYLHESDCDHGLYVVGWFLCDRWDGGDYRKAKTPSWKIQMACEYFGDQAQRISTEGKTVQALVIDARLRDQAATK